MNYLEALEALKNGKKVRRVNWQKKNMYILMKEVIDYLTIREIEYL